MRAVKQVCVADRLHADTAAIPERAKSRKFAVLRAWKEDLADLEYSDYARAPRFLSGWWILPGLALGTLFTLAALSI